MSSDGAGGPSGRDRELYVGYLPSAPPRTARWMRRVVPVLVVGGAGMAALLAALQSPFDPGVFEYGQPRELEGTLVERPYPLLVEVQDPQARGAAGASTASRRGALLVRQGKHGAAPEVRGLDGRRVRLLATRIESPLGTMLELVPESLEPTGARGEPPPDAESLARAPAEVLGRVAVEGEIVDSKCFLGVMKPGRGKPHRSCAARCLSGGIPPQLLVEAADGSRRLLLLARDDGAPLAAADVVPLVGEPVAAAGTVERRAGVLVLRVDRGGLRRAGRARG